MNSFCGACSVVGEREGRLCIAMTIAPSSLWLGQPRRYSLVTGRPRSLSDCETLHTLIRPRATLSDALLDDFQIALLTFRSLFGCREHCELDPVRAGAGAKVLGRSLAMPLANLF